MISQKKVDNTTLLVIENDWLSVEIAPSAGGRITSIFNKALKREFLWNNTALPLEKLNPGADYDSNFWGGIDELLPNDIPENIDGIDYPDHGELWTTALDYSAAGNVIRLSGRLRQSDLYYQKEISLLEQSPKIGLNYKLINEASQARHFLWKLHAALKISEGDLLSSAAKKARIVYANASRFKDMSEFGWPVIEFTDASRAPAKNNTMDFFYLYDNPVGKMAMLMEDEQYRFEYGYDKAVFPYQWYFASYGQFQNHYTAILEPASAMPVSVKEAALANQCSVLMPGEEINTSVTIYAGLNYENRIS